MTDDTHTELKNRPLSADDIGMRDARQDSYRNASGAGHASGTPRGHKATSSEPRRRSGRAMSLPGVAAETSLTTPGPFSDQRTTT